MPVHFSFKSLVLNPKKVISEHGLDEGGKVQEFIDSECLRLSEGKVPKDVGTLIQSGITNTTVGSGEVKWATPYARRHYYHPEYNFSQSPERGAYWFERMKQQHKEAILAGAAKIAGGKTG